MDGYALTEKGYERSNELTAEEFRVFGPEARTGGSIETEILWALEFPNTWKGLVNTVRHNCRYDVSEALIKDKFERLIKLGYIRATDEDVVEEWPGGQTEKRDSRIYRSEGVH